jgi:uncharacterized membrane protein YeiH
MLMLVLLDYLGTFAFAVSGALKAVRKHMDPFGLAVLAVVTAIGGGTVRDLLLAQEPFWLTDHNYILLSLLAAGAVLGLYRLVTRLEQGLLWWDAIGLGTFTVIGAQRAMDHHIGFVGTVVLACLTGVGGGMIRDILAADVPVVLRKEVYASAVILGAILFWFLKQWGVRAEIAVPVCMVTVTTIRLVSLHYGFSLPQMGRKRDGEEEDVSY